MGSSMKAAEESGALHALHTRALVCSLQGKTEYGEFFLKSLCERPTKPLQEKKMKDFFKKKPNRKGNVRADS